MKTPRLSWKNQLLLLPIVLVGIAIFEQYNTGWSAGGNTPAATTADPSPLVEVTPVDAFTPAAITRVTKINDATQAAAKAVGCKCQAECGEADCKCVGVNGGKYVLSPDGNKVSPCSYDATEGSTKFAYRVDKPATNKPAANRKTIQTGDQQCRLNADGTSSCAQAGGACGAGGGARSGPVRRFYHNGGVFRRGLFRGRCRGGC